MAPTKISLETIIENALTDSKVEAVSSSLFGGATFPARSELAKYGLTEVNYLALQQSEPDNGILPAGIIYSIPGGAASGLAFTILDSDLTVRRDLARSQSVTSRINVFLMIHGAIAPNPPIDWNFHTSVDNPQGPCVPARKPQNSASIAQEITGQIPAEECELFKQGYHTHNISARGNFLLGQKWYEKLSCGGGGENTLDTRVQAWETYSKLEDKWAASTNPSVRFFIVEAIAPITGLPHVRIYCDDYPFQQLREVVDPISSFRRPGDDYRISEDQVSQIDYYLRPGSVTLDPQVSCQDYPIERLREYGELNDILRLLMNEGESVVGIGCSDARQGLCIGPEADLSNDAHRSELSLELKLRRPRREHLAGHSEPLGLILLGTNMQKVAYYLLSHHLYTKRREPTIFPSILSQAWPFLVNVPRSIWISNNQAITSSLEQLLSSVDQGYRKRLNPFFATPRIFMADHDGVFEIVTRQGKSPGGLQFFYPDELESSARHIRPGLGILKVTLKQWGMSSGHVRANYDRLLVDTFQFDVRVDAYKESSTASREEQDNARGFRKDWKEWWGMSSGYVRANYDRRSVDNVVRYATVFFKKITSNETARAHVGWMLPFSRRKLGISVPADPPETP